MAEWLIKLRGRVRDHYSVVVNGQVYEVLSSLPSEIPPIPYPLGSYLNQEVILEGQLVENRLYATNITLLKDYQPAPPATLHRLGTTLHPLHSPRPLHWRGLWSFTHAIEPEATENPPWNDALGRNPAHLQRVIEFLAVEKTPRYQPRAGWTGSAVFIADVTRLLCCEIPLNPKGERRWYNRNPNEMIQYIRLVSMVEQGWRWVETPATAQDLANQGYPVLGLKYEREGTGHLVVVVAGNLSDKGFPLVAQAGLRCFGAGRWGDPAVQYITHA